MAELTEQDGALTDDRNDAFDDRGSRILRRGESKRSGEHCGGE
jgi:hypothetical protein